MSKNPSDAARRLFEQALLLVVRRDGGAPDESAAAARELSDWESRDTEHASACRAALNAWQNTDVRILRDEFALPALVAGRKRKVRRRLAALLGLGGLAVASGGIGLRYWQQPSFTLVARTGQGQIETHTLPDGSRIDLAPHTGIAVAWHRNRRLVSLAAGAARFDVAPDAKRPFEIETKYGRIRVLGTAFAVDVRDEGLHVAVAHGRVAVWQAGRPWEALPDAGLGAGDAVSVHGTGMLRHYRVLPEAVGAWRQGWLVFEGTPLDRAVARWNDYLAAPLDIGSSQILHRMRLTGSFPAGNPQTFLETLPRTHPVEVIPRGYGRFLIRPRGRADGKK